MSETSLESLSTERLLALYLMRSELGRDCEPILAEARRRDAELAALRPLGRTAREYSVGWATDFALHQEAREYAGKYKPRTEGSHA